MSAVFLENFPKILLRYLQCHPSESIPLNRIVSYVFDFIMREISVDKKGRTIKRIQETYENA